MTDQETPGTLLDAKGSPRTLDIAIEAPWIPKRQLKLVRDEINAIGEGRYSPRAFARWKYLRTLLSNLN